MARTISYMQAINEAMAQEMSRDESVVVFGEDNVGGTGSPGEEAMPVHLRIGRGSERHAPPFVRPMLTPLDRGHRG